MKLINYIIELKNKGIITQEEFIELVSRIGKNKDKKKWSREELEYIKKNYKKKTLMEMANELGRDLNSIRYVVYDKLKLKKR